MGFLQSRLKTSSAWEELAKSFFGHWEEAGFGNLDKSKLEALLIYCLHMQDIVPANGTRVSLSEAVSLNKDPAELDRLLVKGYTLFNKSPIDTQLLIDSAVRSLTSSAERIINGSLEFHCASKLDCRYITELFERCGINPEQGRNSKILLVELASLDGKRADVKAIYSNLCARLGIAHPSEPISYDEEKSGHWLVECLKLSRNEIFKAGISIVVRDLLSSLLHTTH